MSQWCLRAGPSYSHTPELSSGFLSLPPHSGPAEDEGISFIHNLLSLPELDACRWFSCILEASQTVRFQLPRGAL